MKLCVCVSWQESVNQPHYPSADLEMFLGKEVILLLFHLLLYIIMFAVVGEENK